MTLSISSLQYRVDWITQRTGEGLLYLRYYWWCGQFLIMALIPAMYRCGGAWGVIYLCGRAYVYEERHGWKIENPVSAVDLIMMMRRESELRAFRGLFDGPAQPDNETHYGYHYVTPLEDRDPYPWREPLPVVVAVVSMPDKVNPFEVPQVPMSSVSLAEHPCWWEDPGKSRGVHINILPKKSTEERVPV